jgi:hypothetical protein
MFATRRRFQRLYESGIFQPEIQEARAGDFHFFANFGNVKLSERVGGELARICFAHLGERHQGVGLVVAKFRIARADKHSGDICVRQNLKDGCLELQLNLFVWQHGENLIAKDTKDTKETEMLAGNFSRGSRISRFEIEFTFSRTRG